MKIQDVERMMATIAPIHPNATKEFQQLSSEINSLGGIDTTTYYCWHFVVPQHVDRDRCHLNYSSANL